MAIGLVEALTAVAKEDLSPGIREMLPEIDPIWKLIHNSWESVERGDLGRPGRNSAGAYVASTWVKRWMWKASGGGAFKYTNPSPNLATELAAGSQHHTWASNSGFPSVTDYVWGKMANPVVSLIEGRGTLAMPWQLLQADQIENVLVNMGSMNLQDSAELTSHSEAICWTSRNPTWGEVVRTYAMRDVAGAGVFTDGSGMTIEEKDLNGVVDHARLTFKNHSDPVIGPAIDFYDSVSRLRPGMSVQVWEFWYDLNVTNASCTAKDSTGAAGGKGFVVDHVNYQTQEFSLVTKDGLNVTPLRAPAAIGANDVLVYIVTLHESCGLGDGALEPVAAGWVTALAAAASKTQEMQDVISDIINGGDAHGAGTPFFYGPDGLRSWILPHSDYSKSLYGIDVKYMPNIVSLDWDLMSTEGGGAEDYASERLMDRLCGWFKTQMGPRFRLNTIIGSNGVLSAWAHNQVGKLAQTAGGMDQMLDRTGKPIALKVGFSGLNYAYREESFNIVDSPMFPRKTLVALNTANGNYQRVMPPPIPGATGKSEFQDVMFIAPLGGSNGVYKWAHDGEGKTTDYVEGPYVVLHQHMVNKPPCVRVTGLKEIDPWNAIA